MDDVSPDVILGKLGSFSLYLKKKNDGMEACVSELLNLDDLIDKFK